MFLFDTERRLLLQRRARRKYHSGGLWTNTCCGHPRPGEDTVAAGARRLREEMGIACDLRAAGSFTYRASMAGDLVEHEYDHVLVGMFAGTPHPDPEEVAGWRWATVPEIRSALERRPTTFTAWFPQALDVAVAGFPTTSRGHRSE